MVPALMKAYLWSRLKIVEYLVEGCFVAHQKVARFAAIGRTYYAGGFELVNDTACSGEAYGHFAL